MMGIYKTQKMFTVRYILIHYRKQECICVASKESKMIGFDPPEGHLGSMLVSMGIYKWYICSADNKLQNSTRFGNSASLLQLLKHVLKVTNVSWMGKTVQITVQNTDSKIPTPVLEEDMFDDDYWSETNCDVSAWYTMWKVKQCTKSLIHW